jgi:hypothetical protein
MKTSIFVLCLFCAVTAFGQQGTVLNPNVQPFSPPSHPQHASQHEMGQETSLLSTSSYSWAKGEVPLADLASPMYYTPLGDIARAYREEHANAPKAVLTLEKQK